MAANTFVDSIVGASMLVVASAVFFYYTVWTLLLPFVNDSHPLQALFPPRVWAIRIPVILLLLGGTVVGTFLASVMIRSNRKQMRKAALAKSK
ncbi:hypothetical protein K470DRAFT_272215 [Piedraia hortae CBS 480.64]|uniref:Dolichol phosphate-mannose biosynthesis regulatory protein n=1 Tax=Piedraia hortae CBS 480.64 TaxID=1314780 RepID=A0A6A7BU07_9PEZI|nr:hypothetical protein K470DRAFT_272215 [Piedraia hortae CBS 480.64]